MHFLLQGYHARQVILAVSSVSIQETNKTLANEGFVPLPSLMGRAKPHSLNTLLLGSAWSQNVAHSPIVVTQQQNVHSRHQISAEPSGTRLLEVCRNVCRAPRQGSACQGSPDLLIPLVVLLQQQALRILPALTTSETGRQLPPHMVVRG